MRRRLSSSRAIERLGLTKAEASSLLKVNRTTLWRWLSRRSKPRGDNAKKMKVVRDYASRFKRKPRSAKEKERRENKLKELLDALEQKEKERRLEQTEHDVLNLVELGHFITERIAQIRLLVVNGDVINDSAFAWWTDEVHKRRDENPDDISELWRITLDYEISFNRTTGELRITTLYDK